MENRLSLRPLLCGTHTYETFRRGCLSPIYAADMRFIPFHVCVFHREGVVYGLSDEIPTQAERDAEKFWLNACLHLILCNRNDSCEQCIRIIERVETAKQ